MENARVIEERQAWQFSAHFGAVENVGLTKERQARRLSARFGAAEFVAEAQL